MNRVVMVLGVRRVDGDKRQMAPILAPAGASQGRGFRLLRLGQCSSREEVWDTMRVDSDKTNGFFALNRPHPLGHTAFNQAQPVFTVQSNGDEIAILRVTLLARRHHNFAAQRFFIDRQNATAALGGGTELANSLGLVFF